MQLKEKQMCICIELKQKQSGTAENTPSLSDG